MGRKIFVFGDYSQAEARVVAWKGPVPRLKEWFKNGEDVHLNVARDIGEVVHHKNIKLPGGLFLRKDWRLYDKEDEERDIAKRTVHANNYGQGAEKFALVTGLPEMYAKLLQGIYHSRFPEIKSQYQAGIQATINKDRMLRTPFGGRIIFYDIVKDDLYREGFAWYPQNIVGYLTTRWWSLNRKCFKDYNEVKTWTPTNLRSCGLDERLQVHDSIGITCDDDPLVIGETVRIMRRNSEFPCVINGDSLVIPVDFKIGYSWGDVKDYKEG